MALDRTNARLIEILQNDARTTVSDLSRRLGRAETTMRERVAALEKKGFITGYRATVDAAKMGFPIHAIIRADCDMANLTEVGKALSAIPNVISAQMTTGPKPVRIDIVAESLARLEECVSKRVSTLKLRDIEMGLVVQKLVDARGPPVRAEGEGLVLAPAALDAEAATPTPNPTVSAFTPRV